MAEFYLRFRVIAMLQHLRKISDAAMLLRTKTGKGTVKLILVIRLDSAGNVKWKKTFTKVKV